MNIAELLLGLALSILLGILAISTLRASVKLWQTSSLQKQQIEQQTLLTALANKLSQDLDSHPFKNLVRVHSNGLLNTISGEINTLSQRKDLLAMNVNSSAITLMNLKLSSSYRSSGLVLNNENEEFVTKLCPLFSTKQQITSGERYLALGSMTSQTIAIQAAETNKASCVDVIARTEPTILNTPSNETSDIYLLILIKDYYTIYQDQLKRIRKVTHTGIKNTSNQIIGSSAGNLKITLSNIIDRWPVIELTLQRARAKVISANAIGEISRLEQIDFLVPLLQ